MRILKLSSGGGVCGAVYLSSQVVKGSCEGDGGRGGMSFLVSGDV